MTADNRSTETRQQLSALVDGELERDQARFLFKRLDDDAELTGAWQRWHVVGECLRGHGPAAVRAEFMANISLAIADDPTPRSSGVSRETLKWIGGFAVAASVALVALMAVRPGVQDPANAPQPLIAVVPPPGAEVAPSPYRVEDLRPPVRGNEAMTVLNNGPESEYLTAAVRVDPRIEGYLVRHNEATAAQGQGFVSYIPLVTPVRERVPAAAASR